MHLIQLVYSALVILPLFQQPAPVEWNKKSTFETDRQVEFPGIVLEAGVYTVRLQESGARRSFVQILNQDETQLLASVLAVPDHRMRREDSGEFTFHQVESDGPQPVQSWFYSGEPVGLEFVYPELRAKEIARESNDHVAASSNSKDVVILAVTPNGKEIILNGQGAQAARRKPQ